MSQHVFEQTVYGQKLRVQIGWDKPCQRFYRAVFPWVEDQSENGSGYWDEERPKWSNLYFSQELDLDQIISVICGLDIEIPDHLPQYVMLDKRHNAVNRRTYYNAP